MFNSSDKSRHIYCNQRNQIWPLYLAISLQPLDVHDGLDTCLKTKCTPLSRFSFDKESSFLRSDFFRFWPSGKDTHAFKTSETERKITTTTTTSRQSNKWHFRMSLSFWNMSVCVYLWGWWSGIPDRSLSSVWPERPPAAGLSPAPTDSEWKPTACGNYDRLFSYRWNLPTKDTQQTHRERYSLIKQQRQQNITV